MHDYLGEWPWGPKGGKMFERQEPREELNFQRKVTE